MSGRPRIPAGLAALVLALACACPALAQAPAGGLPTIAELMPQADGSTTGRMIQLVLAVTVLSLAPGILVMTTCFTRFIIALSFLRAGLGLPTTPANLILISLALFMTFAVMGPVFERSYNEGVTPLLENRITQTEAMTKIAEPFRTFMQAHVRPQDVALIEDIVKPDAAAGAAEPPAPAAPAAPPAAAAADRVELRVLVPAFMLSELRRGFEIGFLIMLPFLVIDLIVATLTMSMGMMMLSPTVISLPFKVLFFVLIDGWALLAGGLLRSF